MKKGLLQQLFPVKGQVIPKIRFTGFNEEWEQRQLSDGMIKYTERVFIEETKSYEQISVKNVGEIILRGKKIGYKIGRKRQAKINLHKYPNTLIFTRQTIEQGGIGFAPPETHGAIVTENMPTINVDTNIFDPNYFLTLVKTNLWYQDIILKNIDGGTAQIAIHEDKILLSKILFPKLNEQEIIGKLITRLNKIIAIHENSIQLYQDFKKGLLQKMFVN